MLSQEFLSAVQKGVERCSRDLWIGKCLSESMKSDKSRAIYEIKSLCSEIPYENPTTSTLINENNVKGR